MFIPALVLYFTATASGGPPIHRTSVHPAGVDSTATDTAKDNDAVRSNTTVAPRPPRQLDQRVGWISPLYQTPGGNLMRQRLRVRPSGASSWKAVQPIVYTIDETVPRKWIPWIRQGIEAWLPAFEQIGIRNAIVVRDITEPGAGGHIGQMPGCTVTWDKVPHDGAVTTMDRDSETGDITSCTMHLNDGFMGMLQRYAFLYLGATNPAMQYPYPDSISGRFLRFGVMHETGHSLGFDENPDAGTIYPTDSLHSDHFLRQFSHTPSIMGYTFFDVVAQDTDHIAFDDLMERIGPVNVWALGLMYRPVPGARTSQDEHSMLERWRSVQDTSFAMHATTNRPHTKSDLGLLGSDLVASAEAITRNFARTVPQIDAQAAKAGPDGAVLATALRTDVMNLWPIAVAAAGDVVGGKIRRWPYTEDTAQAETVPVDSGRQVRALKFVLGHVMYGQDPLVQALFGRSPQDTLVMLFSKVTAPGWTADQWQELQQSVLGHLLKHWLPAVVEQASTTHVLPVWCGEMHRLERALVEARTHPASPEDGRQADALLAKLQPALQSVGACK